MASFIVSAKMAHLQAEPCNYNSCLCMFVCTCAYWMCVCMCDICWCVTCMCIVVISYILIICMYGVSVDQCWLLQYNCLITYVIFLVAVHRYYESRWRVHSDEPHRHQKVSENKIKAKRKGYRTRITYTYAWTCTVCVSSYSD